MKMKPKRKRKPNVKSLNSMVACVCPRCGKEHKRRMFWTGKGNPRKFCDSCLIADDIDFTIDPELISNSYQSIEI